MPAAAQRRRARRPHPRPQAGHRGPAHPGARRDRADRGADGVVRRRADGGRRGEVRRPPRPPRRGGRHHARPGDRQAAALPRPARHAAARHRLPAAPRRPGRIPRRARSAPAASSRTAPARTRASAPATAACSATSATTSSPSSRAPRRSACWTSSSATGPPPASPDTGHISLWDQVESELEARFAKALEDWAAGSAESVLYRRGAVLNGYRTADLHISRPDGRLVHWQVTLQNTIDGTRPDVLFRRVDAAPLTVAVYLDGYAYHAAPDKNRLAGDADQRTGSAPRAPSCSSSTGMTSTRRPETPAESISRGTPTRATRRRPRAARTPSSAATRPNCPGSSGPRPVRTLFAFLSDPDRAAWSRRAQAAVAGLLRQPGAARGQRGPNGCAGADPDGSPRSAASLRRRRPGHARPRRGRERLPGHGHHRCASAGTPRPRPWVPGAPSS